MQEEHKIREVLEKLKTGYFLPSLSGITVKLVDMASRDNTSVNDLVELIEKDPSLTTRLINLANSAFFRTIEPIASIERAVMRIGFNHLRIMALSLSIKDAFPMGKNWPMDYEKFWKASLYRAILSKSLAHQLKNCDPGEAFVAGLVQEIGLLLLFDMFIKDKDELSLMSDMLMTESGEMVELNDYPLKNLLALELERYGIDHRRIGEVALNYWKFPEAIIACQNTDLLEDDAVIVSSLCLNCEVARILSSIILHESAALEDALTNIKMKYNLEHDAIGEILMKTFYEVEGISESFRIDINSRKDFMDIMEKANKVLAHLSQQFLTGGGHDESEFPNLKGLEDVKDQAAVQQTLQAVAHEIRNPLTSVGGFVKKMSAMVEPSSKGYEYVQIIIEEADKLEKALSKITGSAKK